MDTSSEQEGNNEDGTPTDEYISSYVWSEGHICAAYFNVTTFEMYLTYETVDLKPDFCHLKNLMGRINARTVLASGPNVFLLEIMRIRGLPNAVDPNQYRLDRLKSMSAATFIVCTSNEKTLVENRLRILQLHLPRMSPTITNQERFNFIENLVPLHQNLVVQSLGNLLNFLDANWRHLFLRNEERPIISNLFVYSLEGSVLIDEGTFNSLQVFTATDHPSAFKKNSRCPKEASQSLFSLMNTCVSRYGSNQLKTWLYQPIRDVDEIHLRLHTIEWLRDEKNAISMTSIRNSLKQINNTGELYARLVRTHGKVSVWKAFKRTLYHTNNIGEICKKLLRINTADVAGTHIERLGMFANANNKVLNMLKHLDVIIDLEESLSRGRFCVKLGLDDELDQKKEKLLEAIKGFRDRIKRELQDLPGFEFIIHHVTEMGFLIALPSIGTDAAPPLNTNNFKFLYRSGDIFYFTSNLCSEMTEEFGALCIEIHEREEQICERLIQHVYVHIADVQMAVRFTAELDAFMALATFSQVNNLVKPEMITDRKILQISNGRHILLDLQKKFVSNDTLISVDQQNLINILIAPNASGKSVYLKELAQIVYLAHIGSFVPSEVAKIPVVDAIYTRMFNPESMFLSKSAFLTEIQEMSKLISNSSESSLVLVDEMGQGTNEDDGKSLLLSCLEHLASRAEKAPIAIITTHYVDIYDCLVNKPWIKMKTFKMEQTNQGLVSTYKLIEGKCTNRYAKNCAIIRRFIRQTTVAGSESDKSSISDNSISDEYFDTVLKIASDIRNSRTKCLAKMAMDYMQDLAGFQINIDFMDILYKCFI